MGLRKILTDKEPSLHKVCRPVEKFDGRLHKLLDDMVETMQDAHGVGLAAPQIGIFHINAVRHNHMQSGCQNNTYYTCL